MYLSNKIVKAKSFQHPLGELDLPNKIPDDDLEKLVTKLRDSTITKEEREYLAKGHIRLAMQIVGRYLPYAPRKRDVLVAEAMYAIAYALDRAAKKLKDNNFTGWCMSCVHRFVSLELIEGHMGATKHATYGKRQKAGQAIVKVKFEPLPDLPDKSFERVTEIKEILASCIQNSFEREIIKLRMMGHNDEEIAELLGKTKQWIGHTRRLVERRFEGKYNAD